MATNRFLLGIICLIGTCSSGLLGGSSLVKANKATHLAHTTIDQAQIRARIVAIAKTQLGIKEATGENDGKAVEGYLAYTGNRKGAPWCASFLSWLYGKAGLLQPKTAWSPALFPLARQTLSPVPADVFGIYVPNLKRIAHCGLVVRVQGDWVTTIEGNTDGLGARDGDGVYSKMRHKRTIKYFADWIDINEKEIKP